MENLTFEQLPNAVSKILMKLENIERILNENDLNKETANNDQFLNVQQAAEFLGLAVPTIYSKVSKRELPVMKRSKRLYFSKDELTNYLKEGRKLTYREIEESADKYLLSNKTC